MSKASDYIRDYTRDCSNIFESYCPNGKQAYFPWIHPKQARKAVEIEKQEVIEKAAEFLRNNLCNYFDASREDYDKFIEDFKIVINEKL